MKYNFEIPVTDGNLVESKGCPTAKIDIKTSSKTLEASVCVCDGGQTLDESVVVVNAARALDCNLWNNLKESLDSDVKLMIEDFPVFESRVGSKLKQLVEDSYAIRLDLTLDPLVDLDFEYNPRDKSLKIDLYQDGNHCYFIEYNLKDALNVDQSDFTIYWELMTMESRGDSSFDRMVAVINDFSMDSLTHQLKSNPHFVDMVYETVSKAEKSRKSITHSMDEEVKLELFGDEGWTFSSTDLRHEEELVVPLDFSIELDYINRKSGNHKLTTIVTILSSHSGEVLSNFGVKDRQIQPDKILHSAESFLSYLEQQIRNDNVDYFVLPPSYLRSVWELEGFKQSVRKAVRSLSRKRNNVDHSLDESDEPVYSTSNRVPGSVNLNAESACLIKFHPNRKRAFVEVSVWMSNEAKSNPSFYASTILDDLTEDHFVSVDKFIAAMSDQIDQEDGRSRIISGGVLKSSHYDQEVYQEFVEKDFVRSAIQQSLKSLRATRKSSPSSMDEGLIAEASSINKSTLGSIEILIEYNTTINLSQDHVIFELIGKFAGSVSETVPIRLKARVHEDEISSSMSDAEEFLRFFRNKVINTDQFSNVMFHLRPPFDHLNSTLENKFIDVLVSKPEVVDVTQSLLDDFNKKRSYASSSLDEGNYNPVIKDFRNLGPIDAKVFLELESRFWIGFNSEENEFRYECEIYNGSNRFVGLNKNFKQLISTWTEFLSNFKWGWGDDPTRSGEYPEVSLSSDIEKLFLDDTDKIKEWLGSVPELQQHFKECVNKLIQRRSNASSSMDEAAQKQFLNIGDLRFNVKFDCIKNDRCKSVCMKVWSEWGKLKITWDSLTGPFPPTYSNLVNDLVESGKIDCSEGMFKDLGKIRLKSLLLQWDKNLNSLYLKSIRNPESLNESESAGVGTVEVESSFLSQFQSPMYIDCTISKLVFDTPRFAINFYLSDGDNSEIHVEIGHSIEKLTWDNVAKIPLKWIQTRQNFYKIDATKSIWNKLRASPQAQQAFNQAKRQLSKERKDTVSTLDEALFEPVRSFLVPLKESDSDNHCIVSYPTFLLSENFEQIFSNTAKSSSQVSFPIEVNTEIRIFENENGDIGVSVKLNDTNSHFHNYMLDISHTYDSENLPQTWEDLINDRISFGTYQSTSDPLSKSRVWDKEFHPNFSGDTLKKFVLELPGVDKLYSKAVKSVLRKRVNANKSMDESSDLTPEQTKWLDDVVKGTWKQTPNGIEVNGDVDCSYQSLKQFPVEFSKVSGSFICHSNQLNSLKGAPERVDGSFWCHYNQLTTLKGAPNQVGGNFYCHNNQLTSLQGAPNHVGGGFHCDKNQLTTLKGAPNHVGGNFYCHNNQLASLEGAPEYVGDYVEGEINGKKLFDFYDEEGNLIQPKRNRTIKSMDESSL